MQIIGVHTPEFPFAGNRAQVQAAVGRLGIRWPIVMDNDRTIWSAFANSAWPAIYLIDSSGYVRFRHSGEGRYAETEQAIQALLREIAPEASFPDPLPLVRPEDGDDAVCYPSTPELHAGDLGVAFASGSSRQVFALPESRSDGRFYLEGTWRAAEEGITLVSSHGRIVLPFHAATVNAVLTPTPEIEEAPILDPPMTVKLLLDGRPLPHRWFGEDVFLEGNEAIARIDAPRMFALVHADGVQPGELHLLPSQPGLTFYAFSFGSCLRSASSPHRQTPE